MSIKTMWDFQIIGKLLGKNLVLLGVMASHFGWNSSHFYKSTSIEVDYLVNNVNKIILLTLIEASEDYIEDKDIVYLQSIQLIEDKQSSLHTALDAVAQEASNQKFLAPWYNSQMHALKQITYKLKRKLSWFPVSPQREISSKIAVLLLFFLSPVQNSLRVLTCKQSHTCCFSHTFNTICAILIWLYEVYIDLLCCRL